MSDFEFQKDWDQEVRNAEADAAYEQWVCEQEEREALEAELNIHSMDPDQEPTPVAEESE